MNLSYKIEITLKKIYKNYKVPGLIIELLNNKIKKIIKF